MKWDGIHIVKKKIGEWSINNLLRHSQLLPGEPLNRFKRKAARAGAKLFVKHANEGRPLLATIALTHMCHLDCSYCSRGKRADSSDFTTSEVIRLLDWLQAKSCPIINLTGGEPMLRKDIREIIATVDKRTSLQLYTSGINIDKGFGDFLKKRGNVFPFISLLSHQAEEHDRLKGKTGSYTQALEAIKNLKKNGNWAAAAVIATQSSVSNGNFDKLLRFLKSLDVDQVLVFDYKATGKSLGEGGEILHGDALEQARNYHNIHLRDKNYPNTFSLPHVEGDRILGCTAGYCRMYIDASGNVCPCDFLPLSFGNIKEDKIDKIWQRMNNSFAKPYKNCFINTHHKIIAKESNGQLPLIEHASQELCKNYPPQGHAPVYRSLGFNLDLESLIKKGLI